MKRSEAIEAMLNGEVVTHPSYVVIGDSVEIGRRYENEEFWHCDTAGRIRRVAPVTPEMTADGWSIAPKLRCPHCTEVSYATGVGQ